MNDERLPFSDLQLECLTQAFHRGVSDSAAALGKWLATQASVTVESVEQCTLSDATDILSNLEDIACMCQMQMQGSLGGQLLLAFDDASGLTLADILLSKPPGTSTEWGEVEVSAALETMNIVGSAYLNGIADSLSRLEEERVSLIPTPPTFLRDFVESLLESAFVAQAEAGRYIVLAETSFELQNQPLRWTFLLIPDSNSLVTLKQMLSKSSSAEAS